MTRETEQTSTESVPEGKYIYCIIETSEPRSFAYFLSLPFLRR